MNEYKKYRAIKKGEIVDVSEEKLDKIIKTKQPKK